MLRSAERGKVSLISRKIIFSRIPNYTITIPQRHGQTTCHGNTALCVASRGKIASHTLFISCTTPYFTRVLAYALSLYATIALSNTSPNVLMDMELYTSTVNYQRYCPPHF